MHPQKRLPQKQKQQKQLQQKQLQTKTTTNKNNYKQKQLQGTILIITLFFMGNFMYFWLMETVQQTFIYLKSTIKTLEKDVKYVQK